jgi:hypothetical protein
MLLRNVYLLNPKVTNFFNHLKLAQPFTTGKKNKVIWKKKYFLRRFFAIPKICVGKVN